ncbi:MAG: hypothetical protein K2O44_02170 [Clostridia bacterium]|nr:hypothetical protein [Clostridia bacterium]
MKKLFKLLTVAILAVAATVACVFVAGCNGGEDGASDYNFTIVYEDGTAVNGQTGGKDGGKVATQICLPGEDGECVRLSGLNINIFPDANGKLSLTQAKVNELFGSSTDVTVFSFHVMSVPGYKADCEVSVNGKGDYKVTLSK